MSLVIKNSGFYSAIQDRGRRGLRYLGVPWAGIGCEPWMRFANALLNQDLATPVIETVEGGLSLFASGQDAQFAIVGDVTANILQANGITQTVKGWRSYTLKTGDTLTIKTTGEFRCAVLGVKGLAVEPHFGSASTYPNASLGGLCGTPLKAEDELPLANNTLDDSHQSLPVFTFPGQAAKNEAFTVRAVAGPQDDYFSEEILKLFFNSTYTISQDIDRMGARLTGPALEHKSAELRDLVSDAILPGSVQVPGAGQPIVMLVDAHTVGGYPKIATVVSSDLCLFSLYRPNQPLQFDRVDNNTALAHTRQLEKLVQEHLHKLAPVVGEDLSSERLLGLNLVSGVTDALH